METKNQKIANNVTFDDKKAVIIGYNTIIRKNTHISRGVIIGNDTVIGRGCKIACNVVIGNNCQIPAHSTISPGATIGNDCSFRNAISIGTNQVVPSCTISQKGLYLPDIED